MLCTNKIVTKGVWQVVQTSLGKPASYSRVSGFRSHVCFRSSFRWMCSLGDRRWWLPVFESLETIWETLYEFQAPGLAWPSPKCCGLLGPEPANGRDSGVCLCVSAFQIKLIFQNFCPDFLKLSNEFIKPLILVIWLVLIVEQLKIKVAERRTIIAYNPPKQNHF